MYSSTKTSVAIYETNEFGQIPDPFKVSFEPQTNSVNYFCKVFQKLGIFYFRADCTFYNNTQPLPQNRILAVVVIPKIKVHIENDPGVQFKRHPILAHNNDLVVWKFPQPIKEDLFLLNMESVISSIKAQHEKGHETRERYYFGHAFSKSGCFALINACKHEYDDVQRNRTCLCSSVSCLEFEQATEKGMVNTLSIGNIRSMHLFSIRFSSSRNRSSLQSWLTCHSMNIV
jgi:hypothetical protein